MPALDWLSVGLILVSLTAFIVLVVLVAKLTKFSVQLPRWRSFSTPGVKGVKRWPLTLQVAVITGVVFLIFGLLLVVLVNQMVSQEFLSQVKMLTAEFVAKEVQGHLDAQLLSHRQRSRDEVEREHHSFNAFFKAIQTSDMVKVKMWDAQATVIHVHKPLSEEIDFSAVNQSFPENKRYQQALKGEVVVEVTSRKEAEREGETDGGFDALMEVYVPVFVAGAKEPMGVAEVYYNLDALRASLAKLRKLIGLGTGGAFLLLYFVLFLITSSASKTLIHQRDQLRQAKLTLEDKVKERTEELEQAKRKLEEKVADLEKFNEAVVGRELKMIKLKEEIKELKRKLKNGLSKGHSSK